MKAGNRLAGGSPAQLVSAEGTARHSSSGTTIVFSPEVRKIRASTVRSSRVDGADGAVRSSFSVGVEGEKAEPFGQGVGAGDDRAVEALVTAALDTRPMT